MEGQQERIDQKRIGVKNSFPRQSLASMSFMEGTSRFLPNLTLSVSSSLDFDISHEPEKTHLSRLSIMKFVGRQTGKNRPFLFQAGTVFEVGTGWGLDETDEYKNADIKTIDARYPMVVNA